MKRDFTLLLALLVAGILLLFAMSARGEQLYLVGESDSYRYLIDVDTIVLEEREGKSPAIHVDFIGVHLRGGAQGRGVATTTVQACDSDGGIGAFGFYGSPSRAVTWSKQGYRIYDLMYRHLCEWVVVILKDRPEQLLKAPRRKGVSG
jgi:hypothetical protein